MHTLSITDVQSLARHVVLDANEPLMMWGPAGVGKSESIAQLAKTYYAELCTILLSQYDSVDLRGFPAPDNHSNHTIWYPPSTLPFIGNAKFPTDRPIILFLDEINAASQSVAAIAYQLINDRRIGEHVLMDNVRIIAAGNRECDRGVTNRMPAPLANRMTHVEVVVDPKAWATWAQGNNIPPVGIAFLQWRNNLLSTFDPKLPQKVFATPRTWTKAFKYYLSNMPEHIKQAAMAGSVGDGPVAEFYGFVKIWQNLTPLSDIEADPDGVPVPSTKDLSISYALTVAISGAMTPANVDAFVKFLKRMPSDEYVILALQLAIRRDESLLNTDAFITVSKLHKTYFNGGRS